MNVAIEPVSLVQDACLVAAVYLLGGFTAGYYLVRARTDLDVRAGGSGSAGATNVARLLGRRGFVVTFALDFLKGAAAVGLARAIHVQRPVVAWVMWAVVAGHIWPLHLRFRGGKGVATGLGSLLAYEPRLLVVLGLSGLIPLAVLRNLTLAGMAAFVLAPVAWFLLEPVRLTDVSALAGLALLILVAHRRNIREEGVRLWTEGRARRARRRAARD